MLFNGGFTFTNFLADVFAIFIFILWFWLLITVTGDLFRRHDVSGFAKVLWVILLIVLPYIGIFAYLLTQGRGMAERNQDVPNTRARNCATWWASARRTRLRNSIGLSRAVRSRKRNTPCCGPAWSNSRQSGRSSCASPGMVRF